MLSFGNAAGSIPLHRLDLVEKLCKVPSVSHINIGPFRRNAFVGNEGETFYYHPTEKWSLNALGLPAQVDCFDGSVYIQKAAAIAHASGKKLRVTIAGFTPEEYVFLAILAFAFGADEVEYNLGCPNVWGDDGVQKPIPSYDFKLVDEILILTGQMPKLPQVDLKISPVPREILEALAKVFAKHSKIIRAVVAINTIPNKRGVREDGTSALNFNNGNQVGGLAGEPARAEAVRVLSTLRELLDWLPLIGVGGISRGEHILELRKAGANLGVQVGTEFFRTEDPQVMQGVIAEFAELISDPESSEL